MKTAKRIPCLLTTSDRGVFMGYVKPEDVENDTITATEVRMCVYWSADMRGVLGLAIDGPSKTCKISRAAIEEVIKGIRSVVKLTEKAERNWKKEPWG